MRAVCFCASMILRTITCLTTVLVLAGFEASPQTPSMARQKYPAIISDSTDRRVKAEREWRRMLDSYGVPQTPPDLYPITNTPRSLLGVAGGLQLLGAAAEPGNEVF